MRRRPVLISAVAASPAVSGVACPFTLIENFRDSGRPFRAAIQAIWCFISARKRGLSRTRSTRRSATPGLQLSNERVHLAFVDLKCHALAGIELSKPGFDLGPVPGVGIQPRLHRGGRNGLRSLALAGGELRQPLGVSLG